MRSKIIFVIVICFFFILFATESRSQEVVNVESINKEKLERLINERDGKILLLNIWATWCIPCREEFPDLIKLNNTFKDEVDVVGISADYPDEVEEKVLPFLKKIGANFKIYVNDFKVKPDLIDYLEKEWNGALPASFIYDKSGNREFFFQGKKSFEEFEEALTEVLK